ncbi:MAG: tetratricopeptide repeat protein [Candidatus Aminicenantes bacterium]|nr:tetratricopeptide repeat protein [Candidatus Aminicenantes bacterium]
MEDKKEYLNRGRLLSVQGKFKEAIDEYKKAIEIDPNYKQAKANLRLINYLYYRKKEGED